MLQPSIIVVTMGISQAGCIHLPMFSSRVINGLRSDRWSACTRLTAITARAPAKGKLSRQVEARQCRLQQNCGRHCQRISKSIKLTCLLWVEYIHTQVYSKCKSTSRMHGIVGEQKQVVATVLQRPVCVHAEQQQACL